MADRQEWVHATQQSRHLAIASDAELLRRYPDRKIEPLRSAEQGPASDNQREHPPPGPEGEVTEAATRIRNLATQHQAFRAKLNERQRQMAHSRDLDWVGRGETMRPSWAPSRDAILQPPKPQIIPSERILQMAVEHDTEPEAAD
jgi:hypothetical protein